MKHLFDKTGLSSYQNDVQFGILCIFILYINGIQLECFTGHRSYFLQSISGPRMCWKGNVCLKHLCFIKYLLCRGIQQKSYDRNLKIPMTIFQISHKLEGSIFLVSISESSSWCSDQEQNQEWLLSSACPNSRAQNGTVLSKRPYGPLLKCNCSLLISRSCVLLRIRLCITHHCIHRTWPLVFKPRVDTQQTSLICPIVLA